MSIDEVREFCQRILPYQIPVQVRLKGGDESIVGKIVGVETERFHVSTEDQGIRPVRFSWVARVRNA